MSKHDPDTTQWRDTTRGADPGPVYEWQVDDPPAAGLHFRLQELRGLPPSADQWLCTARWSATPRPATAHSDSALENSDTPLAALDQLLDLIPATWLEQAETSRHDVMGAWMTSYGPAHLEGSECAPVELETDDMQGVWEYRLNCSQLSLEIAYAPAPQLWIIEARMWDRLPAGEFATDPLLGQRGQFRTTVHPTLDLHVALSESLHNLPPEWLQESNTDIRSLLAAWMGAELAESGDDAAEAAVDFQGAY